jgi:Family of unknown function (DUF6882)
MDNFKIFVTDALEKFDKNAETYDKMFKDVYTVKYAVNESEIDHDQIIFFDKDNNNIINANYEIAGTYYADKGTWIWPWSDPNYNKKLTVKSKNLLLYGLKLSPDQNYSLKFELTNSRFLITDPIQIDIHLAIASELSKNPCVFKMYVPLLTKDIEEKFLIQESERFEDIKMKAKIDIDDIKKYKIVYFFLFNVKELQ